MIRVRTWFAAALPLLLAAPALAAAPGAIGDLYVTSDTDDMCRQYDLGTGNLVGTYFTSVNGVGQLAIHYNAASSKVLIGHFSGGVDEFDADTGAWIKTYNPGGGTQWAGIYAPNGNVYIGSWNTNDVREYDGTTGAFIGVLTTVSFPSDMRYGPSGDLFICSYDSFYVKQVDANTGAFIDQWSQPSDCRPNDLEFLPSGDILVTAMGTNVVYHY
ncbi:MAG: hypothetical protein KC591_06600, partial [Gemmatimonadetes bacterium]|nr:hypothetical protein [Gemmatimonadota bacterium]